MVYFVLAHFTDHKFVTWLKICICVMTITAEHGWLSGWRIRIGCSEDLLPEGLPKQTLQHDLWTRSWTVLQFAYFNCSERKTTERLYCKLEEIC
jgi:hypothetical protein